MEVKFRIAVLLLMSLIVGAVWIFPTWYPLINIDLTREVFPGLDLDFQDDFLRLPEAERDAFFALLEEDETAAAALPMVEARLEQDTLAPENELLYDPGNAAVVRRGEFEEIDVIRNAEGDVIIYQSPDQSRLLRIEEFRSTRAPDVHVVLTRNPEPLVAADVGVDYIDLGGLKATVGNQNYAVPADVDFNRYPAVTLYSISHQIVVSSATLR